MLSVSNYSIHDVLNGKEFILKGKLSSFFTECLMHTQHAFVLQA